MVLYMPKINLHGELCVSTELYQRLAERGLLKSEDPEDFNYYLQECIARDNSAPSIFSRLPIAQAPATSQTKSEPVDNHQSDTDVAQSVNKEFLAATLSTLYRR